MICSMTFANSEIFLECAAQVDSTQYACIICQVKMFEMFQTDLPNSLAPLLPAWINWWISIHSHDFMWYVFTHACPNFNSCLKFGHERGITLTLCAAFQSGNMSYINVLCVLLALWGATYGEYLFIRFCEIYCMLTHWGRATHKCVSKLTIIGSDNGLSLGRRQAIIWTNAGLLLIWPFGTNLSEIEIHTFSFKKMHLKMSSRKWQPFVSASICWYCN